jgi:DNA-binding NtrC family response regulator
MYLGSLDRSQSHLDHALNRAQGVTHVKLGVVDTLAQLALGQNGPDACKKYLDLFAATLDNDKLPARSWYDLVHQLTRCAYFEKLEDWHRVIAIVDDADPEITRRQYRAVRASLLSARARALARLGRHAQADQALGAAMRACPRGAVDPLIVLEASKALCVSLRGDVAKGSVHYDRALAVCRAIGHRHYEAWIDASRADVERTLRTSIAGPRRTLETTETALLVSDVATILGAGHSIELLAHRTVSILKNTTAGPRVKVRSESGRPYHSELTATWDVAANGTFSIRLRGSDRLIAITVGGVPSLDEISLLKGVAEIVQAAISRTAGADAAGDEQNLWPQTPLKDDDETVFRSPRMVELVRVAVRLAATNLPILISGETGTGKEVLARLVHEHSNVRRGPFVAFNCSAVPRELVESQLFGHRRGAFTGATESFSGVIRTAERGTLFLDEVGDLDLAVQPKLLRFLENAEVHPVGEVRPQRVPIRVVTATNADLDQLVDQGRFRRDLFYRLGVARVALPPLRERKDEIPALASLFLARFARECGRTGVRLGDDLIAALLLYDWPGNIRQLANEIRRVVAMAADGQTLTSGNLAPEIARAWNARPTTAAESDYPAVRVRLDQPLALAVDELERKFIEHAMTTADGRVNEAAGLLGLSRKGLFLKRRRRGLMAR